MTRRSTIAAAATCFIVAVGYNVQGQQAPASAPSSQSASARQVPAATPSPQAASARQAAAPSAHQAVISKYCVSCHNEKLKSGGLALTTLDLTQPSKNIEAWENVIRKVRTGAMPPVGRPRPDKATATGLVTFLETELDRAAFENVNPGRPSLQRLNRAEYSNAIRDLLGVEIDAASLLPADVAGYGFDN